MSSHATDLVYATSSSSICEEGLGATGPHIPETAGQYVTADKP